MIKDLNGKELTAKKVRKAIMTIEFNEAGGIQFFPKMENISVVEFAGAMELAIHSFKMGLFKGGST